MMKRISFLLLFAMLLGSSCSLFGQTEQAEYRVTVAGRQVDCPVVISGVPMWAKSAVVKSGDREIASQLDIPLAELAFVADIDQSREFTVVYSSQAAKTSYPARVHAQMWLKNPDKTLRAADTVASFKDDMYNKLHHHGPAFESEYACYRVYFDKKQTIDTYGKKKPQLELAQTMWYPSDEQLKADYGHDNLRVFGSVGVGTLKGWDAQNKKQIHITDFKRREARILAKGPVRTIVEMAVEGWNYCGREIDMTSRYILYAGHSDVQVQNTIKGDFSDLLFATGVMKMRDNQMLRGNGSVAAAGSDYPENDSLKWQRERVGLAVAIPGNRIASQIDDSTSYLFQLRPDQHGRIDYVFEMQWRRSKWLDGISDASCLTTLLGNIEKARMPVTVVRIR